MKLNIPTYSSDMFTWNKNRAVADASDFGSLKERGTNWIGSRLYDDACDIGFYVVSAKTGVKMLFTYVHDEDGYDGELQVYSSGDYKITIFND
jgi:hypothetical protein